jgi:hypothetical protein
MPGIAEYVILFISPKVGICVVFWLMLGMADTNDCLYSID